MIKSVKISNIGSLVSFDNTGSEFNSKRCVVHGLNGSGKSQLCGLLSRIARLRTNINAVPADTDLINFAKERLSKEATNTQVEVKLDSTNIIIETDGGRVGISGKMPHLHVFNEEYLATNIGSIIDFQELPIRIGETNKERDELEVSLKKKRQALIEVDKNIDEMIKDARESTGYNTQKRTIKAISRERFLSEINPADAHPTAADDLRELSDPPDRITLETRNLIPTVSINPQVDDLLREPFLKPSLTQAIYQRHVHAHKPFYDEGTQIFREVGGDTCPFCLTPKTDRDKSLAELLSYIESDYSVAETELVSTKKYIEKLCDDVDIFIELSNSENKIVQRTVDKLKMNKKIKDIVNVRGELEELIGVIESKLQYMEKNQWPDRESFVDAINTCIQPIINAYAEKAKFVEEINEGIDRLSGRRRILGVEIVENVMHELWKKNPLRDRRVQLLAETTEIENQLQKIAEKPSNDRTIGFFNLIVRFLGIQKYELSSESHLILRLKQDHDITNEGFRVSAGERKFLGLSYFLAEVLASVSTRTELSDITIVIDDPVDSSDYDRFYSFLSVIEKIDRIIGSIYGNYQIKIGQILIFTHNSLFFERLANSNTFTAFLLEIVNNQTCIRTAKKGAGLTTFSSYLKRICRFVKKMEPAKSVDLGNSIRRILEIIASVENIENNNIRNLTGTSKLNAIANHLSHESIERMLDPLPESHEYLAASIELITLIRERIPFLYETIEKVYLNGKNIDEYHKEYEAKYL